MGKFFCLLLFSVLISNQEFAQSVGIGTAAPNNSAALEVSSTSKGMLPPRMSSLQRQAISNPAAGLLVFDTDLENLYLYNGSYWTPLSEGRTAMQSAFPPDIASSDYFGSHVDMHGNYAVVGAPSDDIGANADQGSVYVYERSGNSWTQVIKLTASDGAANDNFGSSVSVYGDYIAVGASMDDIGANTDQGSVYIFFRNAGVWSFLQKINGNLGASADNFGTSVSLNDSYCVVGAVGVSSKRGGVYWFFKSGNTFIHVNRLTGAATGDSLGVRVQVKGNYTLATAPYAKVGAATAQGYMNVYFYNGSNWAFQSQLTSFDVLSFDVFGSRASFFGANTDSVVVTCWGNRVLPRVCIFSRSGSTWSQSQVLYSPGPYTDGFGSALSVVNNIMLIGVSDRSFPPYAYGAVDLYKKVNNNWVYLRTLSNPFPGGNDYFGQALAAITGGWVVVGVPGRNINSGGVYFFSL